jgi:hypothetical protein
MAALQAIVIITTLITLVLGLLLSISLTQAYLKSRRSSMMFWASALWLFDVSVLMETLFAYGIYSELLIKLYLFIVALLVILLSLGSVQLVDSAKIKKTYYAFSIASTVFLAYSLAQSYIGNIISHYVVFGILPMSVIIASSIMTFPAAIVIIATAYKSYIKKRDKRLLSIILGVIIISVAGTLYIAAIPEFLYLAEFIGIALLWFGFGSRG